MLSGEAEASVEASHRGQLLLCARLEALADRLPAMPPAAEVRTLAAALEECQRVLGDELPPGNRRFDPSREHRLIDACHADDLISALTDYVERGTLHPERLSYMLRCFFDGRRRAIALERALLELPLLQSPANA